MELKIDNSKTYAIALEGGGAKGGYEIGVWQALDEAGIKYNAVSGTSVGALNGGLMAMRDLPRAIDAWNDMKLGKVIELDEEQEENLSRAFNGDIGLDDVQRLIPEALEIIKNRGLDVAPLRAWVREVVDAKAIKESDVELYIATVSITDRKALEVKVNDLPEDQICDMLLASAYHPTFKLEKLGGKFYTDGGFVDTLPLHALVTNGYKDIIAVRIPGIGHNRRFKMPDDVNVTYIATNADLGGVLNFDAEQSRRDMAIGYLDAKRVLYGLYGKHYYIERSMTDREALNMLLDSLETGVNLRQFCERDLPRVARHLDAEGDYYELLIAVLEDAAEKQNIDNMRIYKDTELVAKLEESRE
ncbi:MAG: patatin-like phospholipase family protein [Oscillospiraceae bacterium]